MTILSRIFFGLLFASLTTWVYADDAPLETDIVKQQVQAYMTKHETPGVAVALYVDGKPQSYYFGYANRDKKTPVNEHTIFELGSISKVMTSILLAENIDLAKTQLEVSVKKYLPHLSSDFDDVTLQMLATHTAGLPFELPETIKTKKAKDQYLATFYPDYIVNEQWLYSNVGIELLGEALEKITHKNLNTLYRTRLLAPLGMQAIGLNVPNNLLKYYAQGYDQQGQAVTSEQDLLLAAWGVKASVADMRRFLSATIGLPKTPEQLFYPIRMTQASYVKLPSYAQGLGWQIYSIKSINELEQASPLDLNPIPVTEIVERPVFNGDSLIDKTGSTDGFAAYIAVIPNKKTGIVILANKHDISGDLVSVARVILFQLNHMAETPPASDANHQ